MAVPRTYTRRSPEAARELILESAQEVFARQLPDRVGMREIATHAGVSHGLVTHYFKSYDNLIEQVLERRLRAMRELAFSRLGSATFAPTESPLLDVMMDLLDDPTLTRLLAWSLLVGRTEAIGEAGALGKIIDAMHARVSDLGAAISRERMEMSVVLAISMIAGWSLAGSAIERGIGRSTPYSRETLRSELHRMMHAYVQA